MDRTSERAAAVSATMAAVRQIESEKGVTREGLDAMREALQGLAAQRHLFPAEDFPQGSGKDDDTSRMYCLSEDDDHRFALYMQCCLPGLDVPPHNHSTWAVIVGLDGLEENRFYDYGPDDGPPLQSGGRDVVEGVGVAFLPEELHSIHVHGAPVMNFHMYGLSLTQLFERQYWSERREAWRTFPPQEGIIDRRQG